MKKKIKITPPKDITLDRGADEFITYCEFKNLRPATIKFYNATLEGYIYKVLDPKFPISEITPSIIEDLILYCKERNLKDVSINSMLRGVRAIFNYFMKLDYMDKFEITLPKQDTPIIETYTDAEIEILLKEPDKRKCTFSDYRDWAMCNFLLATGCRFKTIINVKIRDVDFDNNLITYRYTKNRKRQIVPLSSTLKHVLYKYLKVRDGKDDDYLFCGIYGDMLDEGSVSQHLRFYNRKRGVMKTGIHRWRHTFAKKWILEGGDVFSLQTMLGHSSMEMVRRYVNMFSTDLSKTFSIYNPLDNMDVYKEKITMRGRK
ncbi:tyrosine-type recombinase/integrase [Clostridium cylindrosporum]|uniref:Site-specific recombinase XerD n=1 Tax=Clostridium cylindrosporum DSM 605 TaxID=1121307 RepID=A0A0J8DB46_CLOCY|nr:tyrosine-type recombinase/integrase [Clostridium cylindrosporum]KMT21519.1 site-specific recombinase XerD [Clostridium cylindrosporum DSM 605]